MKRKSYHRIMAIVLSLAVFVLIPFTYTEEVQAASTKTYYVVTSYKSVYKNSSGDKDTSSGTYTRDTNGLLKSTHYEDGGKIVYTRNSKGYATKVREYNSNGKFTGEYTFTYTYYKSGNGKGLPKIEKCYYRKAGKKSKKLKGTYTMTYYSNKRVKKKVGKDSDGSYTANYRKNGTLSSYTYKGNDGSTIKQICDKHGNTKEYTNKSKDCTRTENHTTMTYDENGNLEKDVYTYTSKYNGNTSKQKNSVTYTYTYDKHNNITKRVIQTVCKLSDGSSYSYSSTYSAKYKPVKVAKKYQHFFN